MKNLSTLLFELSSDDRLRILQQLSKQAMNVTNLSKALNLTTQETSRHVSRLGEVGLTQKEGNGFLHITSYGGLVLKQLEGLAFTSQHRDYFTTHSLKHLAPEFTYRIGDLTNSKYVNSIAIAFYNIEKIIREAEGYVWTITDQYLMGWLPLITQAFNRKIKINNIEAKDWVVPHEFKEALSAEYKEATRKARTSGLLEERFLERLDVCIFMSEKEVAIIALPLPDGGFDYLGFTSKREEVRKWCSDLFHYYWKRADNRDVVAEELYRWVRKRPEAINVLKNMAAGKEIAFGKELISELERMLLIKHGKLTALGDLVYSKLQK